MEITTTPEATMTKTHRISTMLADGDIADVAAIREELLNLAPDEPAIVESTDPDGAPCTITTDGGGFMSARTAAAVIEGYTPYRYYAGAGCWDPDGAMALEAAGVTVEQAAARTTAGGGGYEATVGYKVANGDLAVADIPHA